MIRTPLLRRLAPLLASVCIASGTAQAAEFGNISINGYGHQSFLRASSNTWLGADSSGTVSDNVYALVVTANVDGKSKVWAQLASISGTSIDVHWFYLDRVLSDSLTVRAGKVLAPLGFYNDIIDARFLQQSTILPLLYQPDVDLIDEAYGGAGATWTMPLAGGRLDFDLYGGQIVEEPGATIVTKQKGLIGGRIDWRTPIDGLRLMLSASTKSLRVATDPEDTRKASMILSAGWQRDALDVKAEYGQIDSSMGGRSDTTKAFYLQAGYSLTDAWIPFVRYDVLHAPGHSSSDPATYQNGLSIGVTYRLNPNVAFRLENQFNSGYAAAVLSGETAAGQGQKTWQMLGASMAFIF
jgi:hypothetical protein